ncbi:glycosyltransferase family 2 protein [Candidatus Woesearchaeota archaeon]|nr:glycosyltransferase family 2 protein [Candidatus Woesearchaeota archaeon]
MSGKFPFVDVIVVNYNGKEVLDNFLASLSKIDYPKDKINSILVDNASSDGSVDFVKKAYPNVKIVANKKNLGYVGINSALRYCNGKYVYFANNDLILHKGCFKKFIDVLEKDSSIAMTTYVSVNYFDPKVISGGTWVSRSMYCGHYARDKNKKITEIPYMGGGFIRKSVIGKFGYLFDPDYFIYAEDLDLGLRIRMLGMKVVMVNGAINYHMHAFTTKKWEAQSKSVFLLERNLLMTFFRIFEIKTILPMLPYVALMRAASILRDLAKLKFGNAFARLKAIFWIILNFRLVLKKRREVQRLRKADDSYILKIFSEKYLLKKPFIV